MQGNLNPRSFMGSVEKNLFLLPTLIAGLGLILAAPAQAQYTFGPQVQSTNTASITYNSGTGTFQYTDAANSSDDTASLPLTGNAASFIASTNGWHASVTANVSAETMTATSDESPGDGMGLSVVHLKGTNEYYVSIVLGQDNNSGGASLDLPDGWYGTGAHFLARLNGTNEDTTPLGASVYNNGDSSLALSGATNTMAATESIGAVSGVVTLGYNASTETVTGYYNGTPVGSYSIAGWGTNLTLTLYVFGSSGEGIGVPAGVDTATNFIAGLGTFSLPQLTIIPYGENVILTWPTNATGFTLESTTNLGSSAVWTTNSSGPVVVIGGQNVVVNPVTGAQQFFRLAPAALGN
jgi:hypothetical protein